MSASAQDQAMTMGAGGQTGLPRIYGDTPSFLGVEPIKLPQGAADRDVVFLGVPWEGAITWGTYSGCELAVKTIRHAAARYHSYLPEYDLDFRDSLNLADAGDVAVVPGDGPETMARIKAAARAVYAAGAIPFSFGGDHSYTPEIVAALAEQVGGQVGVINFDGHLDNMPSFQGDELARCSPMYRVVNCPGVRPEAVVHFGVRGPRNARLQMEVARRAGAKVMTLPAIRRQGLEEALAEALAAAREGTRAVYLSICSDILDAACNPGGPPDFDGLMPGELFRAVHAAARAGIRGLDFVEIYPLQDPYNRSAHLAVWTMLHALSGLAAERG